MFNKLRDNMKIWSQKELSKIQRMGMRDFTKRVENCKELSLELRRNFVLKMTKRKFKGKVTKKFVKRLK